MSPVHAAPSTPGQFEIVRVIPGQAYTPHVWEPPFVTEKGGHVSGVLVGIAVGSLVGVRVDAIVGGRVGDAVGERVGNGVGALFAKVGAGVGFNVGIVGYNMGEKRERLYVHFLK